MGENVLAKFSRDYGEVVEPAGDEGAVRVRRHTCAVHPLRLTLRDLDDVAVLRVLVAEPENELVERKRRATAGTLSKVISALANSDGGWFLLGIDDNGSVFGADLPERTHLRDWLRDVLDSRVDPMPPFEADRFVVDGAEIGVVRVPRSTQTPHFITDTDAVYERRNGQTVRANSDRVRQLYRRGGAARETAIARLKDGSAAPAATYGLGLPAESKGLHPQHLAVIARFSLEEPPPSFAAWVDAPASMQASESFVRRAVDALNDRGAGFLPWKDQPQVERRLAGHVARAAWDGVHLKEVAVAFDEAGVAGYRVAGSKAGDIFTFYEEQLLDRWLRPGLAYLVEALRDAGVLGPAELRLDLQGVRGCGLAGGFVPPECGNHAAVAIDTDLSRDDGDAVADRLWSRLERLAGVRATA